MFPCDSLIAGACHRVTPSIRHIKYTVSSAKQMGDLDERVFRDSIQVWPSRVPMCVGCFFFYEENE